ncbi:chromosome segregation protein SMC [Marinoscillum sp. MHG1-6]|uniref:chromosome segregation protein SMC n=1 Tax=Marinoscillum sp. MHG1-6 TaxID=2959627 RepID=UPI0021573287|nr:chromosome segregation protein SMC [Marinoscillum sp. MHG1-6]
MSNKKQKDFTPYFIGLAVLLLGVVAFYYFQVRNLEAEKEAQQQELNNTVLQLDSISTELNKKIVTISQLGGDIDTLLKVQAQLEEDKKKLLTQRNSERNYAHSLKDKVDGYQELLLMKDVEIQKLQELAEVLMSENTELKVEKQELNKSINEINDEKNELQQKVEQASQLKIEGMTVYAVSSGERRRESPFRNRHIEQIQITFTVLENTVAPIEGKELLIRVVAPDGNVLFDVARGSGSFTFKGREMFYTQKQEILYDKRDQQVTLFYDKGSEYALGNHIVEVYTDEYLMGKGSFEVH